MKSTQPGLSEGVRKIVDEEWQRGVSSSDNRSYRIMSRKRLDVVATRIEAAVLAKQEEDFAKAFPNLKKMNDFLAAHRGREDEA